MMKKDINIRYLIANEQDKRWGLTVSTVGYQHIEPFSEYPPKNHPERYLFSTRRGRVLDEYVLLYIAHGNGTFTSSLKEDIKIKAGTMVLLFPGEWHNYKPDDDTGWDEYWIGFKGRHINERIINDFFDVQKTVFSVGHSLEIVKLYTMAIDVATEQHFGYQQILSGIASLLSGFTYSLDKKSTDDPKEAIRQINKAKMIMFENSHTDITPEDIAGEICMSYSWFRHLFKKYTGLSPHQYIQELRIRKSQELLLLTALTCQEIAYKVGYDNPLSFSIIFKKKVGLSPNKYRDLHVKK
ncbi:MAG: AraC family transcriptional regulator [Tannerella sp.]|jgi:AraC-like DNA-binding protein|nr:AraC family transcriptional regulator [Tannerella sp.]